jgi:hypothetical protein
MYFFNCLNVFGQEIAILHCRDIFSFYMLKECPVLGYTSIQPGMILPKVGRDPLSRVFNPKMDEIDSSVTSLSLKYNGASRYIKQGYICIHIHTQSVQQVATLVSRFYYKITLHVSGSFRTHHQSDL